MPVRLEKSSQRGSRFSDRHGTVVVLAACLMTLLVAFVAFAVDIGYLNTIRTQLQASADAAALAGADTLYDNFAYALVEAEKFGESNVVGNAPADIDPNQDIEFGIWDKRTHTFTPQNAPDAQTDAVRVTVRRQQSRGNSVGLYFGRVLGFSNADVTAYAVAESNHGFCGGFIGLDWAHVHGNSYTDSYWSEDGSYGSQAPGSNGHVCSNGTVTLEGGITVNGNVSTVDGETIDMSTGTPVVNGRLNYRPEPMYAPPIIVGDAETVNDNGLLVDSDGDSLLTIQGHLKVQTGNVAMPPGTYYFNDLTTSGSGQITVSGPTTIFVEGTLNIAGQGIVNVTEDPANLQIYTLGNKATVAGTSAFYGVVYGPTTAVKITGTADYFGVALGKTMEIAPTSTGAGVHHDETVGRLLRVRPRAFLVE